MDKHTMKAKAVEQAARQIVQLEAEATEAERQKLGDWLAESPENSAAFINVRRTWSDVSGLRELAELEPLEPKRNGLYVWPVNGLRWSRPVSVTGFATALITIFIVIGVYTLHVLDNDFVQYETGTSEIREVTLKDGSTITLAPESRISARLTEDQRNVVLKTGEAFFSVAKKTGRPFVVLSGDTAIRVLGTRFNVHKGVSGLTVTVAEGLVEVAKSPLDTNPDSRQLSLRRQLQAGEKVESPLQGGLEDIQTVPVEHAGAWRTGMLYYDNTDLREVVADANRYSKQRIVIVSSELYDLKVIAAFRTDQINQMILALEQNLPITVEHHDSGHILLKPEQ